jgi:hypothetical protein
LTTSVAFTWCAIAPLFPAIRSVNVPRVVERLVRIVRSELPGGVTEFFENVADAPAGSPTTVSATGDAKPPLPLTETVYDVD